MAETGAQWGDETTVGTPNPNPNPNPHPNPNPTPHPNPTSSPNFLQESSEHAIIVDATASEAVSDFYPVWLGKGVHVVTPNKKAGSPPQP